MRESEAELNSTSYGFDQNLATPDVVPEVTSLIFLDLRESRKQACVTFGTLQLQGIAKTLWHQSQPVQLAVR